VVGAPEVPIGEYTVRILEAASRRYGPAFGAAVESRVASRGAQRPPVLAKVALGRGGRPPSSTERCAGFAAGREVISIPPELNVVAEYPIAVLRGAPQAGLARAFVELCLSARGTALLARHGFQ